MYTFSFLLIDKYICRNLKDNYIISKIKGNRMTMILIAILFLWTEILICPVFLFFIKWILRDFQWRIFIYWKNIFAFKCILYCHLLKNKKPNAFLLYCMKSQYALEDNISLNFIFLDTDNYLSTKKEMSVEKTIFFRALITFLWIVW